MSYGNFIENPDMPNPLLRVWRRDILESIDEALNYIPNTGERFMSKMSTYPEIPNGYLAPSSYAFEEVQRMEKEVRGYLDNIFCWRAERHTSSTGQTLMTSSGKYDGKEFHQALIYGTSFIINDDHKPIGFVYTIAISETCQFSGHSKALDLDLHAYLEYCRSALAFQLNSAAMMCRMQDLGLIEERITNILQ